jgi:hypothetical protein
MRRQFPQHAADPVDVSTQAWIDTLDLLLTRHADHTFVPGHGGVGKAQAQEQSGDAVAAVMPALKEKYGHMEFFNGVVKQNILETDGELHGRKRVPPVH